MADARLRHQRRAAQRRQAELEERAHARGATRGAACGGGVAQQVLDARPEGMLLWNLPALAPVGLDGVGAEELRPLAGEEPCVPEQVERAQFVAAEHDRAERSERRAEVDGALD